MYIEAIFDEENVKCSINIDFILGVSIAVRKHLIPSRTQQLSSLAAKVVLGRLSVRIARCTLLKNPDFVPGFFVSEIESTSICSLADSIVFYG